MQKILFLVISTACLFVALQAVCTPDSVVSHNGSGISGGISGADVNDPTIKAVALNCSALWNQQSVSSPNFFKITCLKNATSQVVAGAKYTVAATISETACKKSDIPAPGLLTQSNVDSCALLSNGQSLDCVFTYLSQPWLNVYKLTDFQCQSSQ